ncbi:biotin-dependent carboxyltransferase family protein [Sulfurospirillum arcachonense]|uniref:5-oxoprolinase subunit C family protein n=1 Tax=Sulfurospirillum arcachonense TaxID=57666 RepID=UPI0004681F3F|nr:biotin-dependent carboxyltransferase family protein [Sulfurospirillum arcachonense]
MTGFEVLNAGILATVQDTGRKGLGSIGVTESGVMDEFSYHWLNRLLGNDYGTNALEIVFGGVKLKANGNTTFALSGAKVDASINNQPIEIWKTYEIKDGDILNLGFASSGARIYLGVVGGFDIIPQFGSTSVCLKEGIGGKPLHVKEFLPYQSKVFKDNKKLALKNQPDYDEVLTLRVVAGYQWDLFDEVERDKFFSSEYKVTSQNDRMGYRLSGEKVLSTCKGIISEAIAYGAIQIPSHGEPIVLLKERQTIGGYPKIGSVIPVDCFKLSQMKQDSIVKFEHISLDEARRKCRKFYKFFQENKEL